MYLNLDLNAAQSWSLYNLFSINFTKNAHAIWDYRWYNKYMTCKTDFINFKNKTAWPQKSLFPLLCFSISPHLTFHVLWICILFSHTQQPFLHSEHCPKYSLIFNLKLNLTMTYWCVCLCESAERCTTCRSSLQRALGILPPGAPVVLRRLSSGFVAEKHQTPHRAAAERKLFWGLH